MTIEQAQEILDELQRTEPGKLKGEAKKLFEAIMLIADERDELKEELKQKDKIIDLMSKEIESLHSSLTEEFGKWTTKYCQEEETTIEEIKQYFENKTKEEKYDKENIISKNKKDSI